MKKILFQVCFLFLYNFLYGQTFNPVGNPTPNPVCEGGNITITFTTGGFTIVGGDLFQLLLSNDVGTFPTNPTIIGSIPTANGSNTIPGAIPASLTGSAAYKVKIRAVILNGAGAADNDTSFSVEKSLNINDDPTASISPATSISLCLGATQQLVGSKSGSIGSSGSYTYTWSVPGGGGAISPNPAQTTTYTAPLAGPGTYTVTVTATNGTTLGCNASVTKDIIVTDVPVVDTGGAIGAICQSGTTTALGGSFSGAATSAVWSDGGAGGSFTNNGGSTPATSTYTTSATAPATVTLTLTSSGGSCGTATDSKSLTVNPTPTISASPNSQTHCSGDPITNILITNPNNVSGTTFSWVRTNTTNLTGINASGSSNPITGTLTNITNTQQTSTFTITATKGSCSSVTTVTVIINPTPTVSATPLTQTLCSANAITNIVITNPNAVAGTTFSWTRTNTTNITGIAATGTSNPITGTLTNNTSTQQTTTFTITATANSCPSSTFNVTVIINPGPTVNATPNSQTHCSGDPITNIVITNPNNVAGTTFSWTRTNTTNLTGIAASGTSNPITGTLVNTTNTQQTSVFTTTATAGSCSSNTTVSVIINPTPTLSAAPVTQTICSGTAITNIAITNPNNVSGTTFSWTRTNTTNITGIAASGTSSPVTGTLTNTTNTQQTTTFTITASATGCPSSTFNVTIIVNPTPTVNATPGTQTHCSGDPITNIVITNPNNVAGTTFSWTRTNTTNLTGIAASGTSNPITGTLVNTTNTQQTSVFTTTATAGSCSLNTTVSVIVNPTPTVSASPVTQTICSGTAITNIAITNPNNVSGTTFSWTRTNTTNITGIAASGTSSPVTGTLTNTTNTQQTTTFTITASATGCPSSTFNVTIIVNPTPTVNATPGTQTHCSGDPITNIVITNPNNVAGTTFSWTRTNTTNLTGIAASGTSNPVTGTLINNTNSPQTTTFTITATAGACSSSTTVSVNINPTPTVSATPLTQTKCSGVPITNIVITNPNSVSGTTFSWSRTNTASLTGIAATGTSNPITGTLTNTTTAQQTSTFTITASANTCPSVSFTVTVIINPLPDFSVSPLQGEICVGQASTNFTVTTISGTSTYTWAPSSGLNQTTGANVTASPTVNSTYVITGTTSNGCTKNDQVTVSILPVPVISVSSISTSICSNDTTTLFVTSTGTPVANFNWQPSGFLNTSTGTAVIASVTNSTASPTTQFFSVIGTSAFGCTATDNVTITINPLPNPPTINGKDIICRGEANVVYTIAPPVQATDIFSWSATPAGINAFITNGNHDTCLTDFSGLSSGITSCTLFTSVTTVAFGCKSFGQKTITISGQTPPLEPVIKFSNNPFTLAVLFSQSGTNYRWGRDFISNFNQDTVGFNSEFGNQNLQLFLVPDTNATPLHFDQFYYWVEYFNADINCKQKAYFNIDSTSIFQSLSGIQNKIIESESFFFLYPNPTDGIFILQFAAGLNNQKDQLYIYDLSGKEMENHAGNFNSDRLVINADRKYPPGIYFIKYINHNGGCQISKIIIQ